MTNRILDLSSAPARLSVKTGRLIIEQGQTEMSPLLDEIAVLIASHQRIVFTNAALAGLMDNGAVVIVCNAQAVPVGWLLPLTNHHVQTERFAKQAAAPKPTQKRLWQQIVRAKIRAQANVLEVQCGNDHGLPALLPLVKSDDSSNVEARAARRYWTALFGDEFRRNRDAEDQNRLLNYGYTVLRASVARASCAAGLHPGLGLHHHNRYNPYPLADDLMEPLRPIVDLVVAEYTSRHGTDVPLDSAAKRVILACLLGRFRMGNETRTIFDCANRCANSLINIYCGMGKTLELPDVGMVPIEV